MFLFYFDSFGLFRVSLLSLLRFSTGRFSKGAVCIVSYKDFVRVSQSSFRFDGVCFWTDRVYSL